jgi:hypothetical protein
VPGGRAFITFDFLNPNPARYLDNPLTYFSWPGFHPLNMIADLETVWTGCVPLDPVFTPRASFLDNGERYHLYYPEPEKGLYTAGGLIQERDPF